MECIHGLIDVERNWMVATTARTSIVEVWSWIVDGEGDGGGIRAC